MKSIPIRKKIIILMIAAFVLLLSAFAYFVWQNMLENYRQFGDDFILSADELLTFNLEDNMLHTHEKNLETILKVVSFSRNIQHSRIISPDGTIEFSTEAIEKGTSIFDVEKSFENLDFDAIYKRVIIKNKGEDYTVIKPFFNTKTCQSCHQQKGKIAYHTYNVDFKESRAELESLYFKILSGSFGVLIILFATLSFYLNRSIGKPLHEVQEGLDQIQKGNLKYKFKVKNRDEIGLVKLHFNKMVEELNLSRSRIEELNFDGLRQVDKLATLGELTSGLAHEINNYSGILHSRLEYLKEEIQEEQLPENYAEDIDSMLDQVVKMSKVTKSILRHSKSKRTDFTKTNVNDLLNNAESIFLPLIKKRKINIQFDLPETSPIILCDAAQMEQVLINLISNAIDAISYDGQITASTFEDEKSVNLIIEDNGAGMTIDQIKNIFMPFFTTKPEGKGSGLGLYIVKRIIDEHNAKISVESSLESGTKFIISFDKSTMSL